MGFNLPVDVWLGPGNAGATAAFAALAAFTVASLRRRRFRRRLHGVSSAPLPPPVHGTLTPSSTELPLLEGIYRNRAVHMAFGVDGNLLITLALSRSAERGLEIGAGASPESTPFNRLSRARLERLPAPWSLAIRGRWLWLSVPGNAHDPLLLRRRLELACDLADGWDAENA